MLVLLCELDDPLEVIEALVELGTVRDPEPELEPDGVATTTVELPELAEELEPVPRGGDLDDELDPVTEAEPLELERDEVAPVPRGGFPELLDEDEDPVPNGAVPVLLKEDDEPVPNPTLLVLVVIPVPNGVPLLPLDEPEDELPDPPEVADAELEDPVELV